MFRTLARQSILRLIVLFGVAFSGAIFVSGRLLAAPEAAQAGQVAQPAAVSGAQNQPGKFDFYLLALSWSPSFCEAARERTTSRRSDPQCESRPSAFVVHGLWPQQERGVPSNCQVPAPRLSRAIVDSMLELMPSPRLVFHEWDRHGTCTGLTGEQYFNTVRKARAAVTVPAEYQSIAEPLTVKPGEVGAAFIRANPGLPRNAISVTCDGKRLTGVRICMNKDLSFRDCASLARQSCRADTVVMPPLRGPRAAASSL
jgi:ribonuclease T2